VRKLDEKIQITNGVDILVRFRKPSSGRECYPSHLNNAEEALPSAVFALEFIE
jgi:hypothetical protein